MGHAGIDEATRQGPCGQIPTGITLVT